MKKAIFVSIVFFFSGFMSIKAQTGEDIIKKSFEAMGGGYNWKKINSMKMIITSTMTTAGMETRTTMTTTTLQDKGSKTEMEMTMNGNAMKSYTVITPTKGWTYNSYLGKTTPMTDDQWKKSVGSLDLHDPLNNYNNYFNRKKITYSGKENVDGKTCYKLNSIDTAGKESALYFDASNYYLIRIASKMKGMGSVMDITDYQKLPDGIIVPKAGKTTISSGGKVMTSNAVYTVEVNKPVDENIFKQ